MLAKACINLSMATSTSVVFYKNLPIPELLDVAGEVTEVIKERREAAKEARGG